MEEESPDESDSNDPEDSSSENPEKENPVEVDTAELKMEDLALESDDTEQSRRARIKEIVRNDAVKFKSQQARKYHSKRSTRNPGRPQGSKAKQDKRVKLSDII